MSTSWYIECISHDPPISSDGEVSQHTDHRLDFARKLWVHRDELGAFHRLIDAADLGDYEPGFGDAMSRAAWRFIRQHPKCDVQFRSEYGEVQPIEVPE